MSCLLVTLANANHQMHDVQDSVPAGAAQGCSGGSGGLMGCRAPAGALLWAWLSSQASPSPPPWEAVRVLRLASWATFCSSDMGLPGA